MMLDVDFVQLREGILDYLPIGVVIGLIVLVELALVFGTWSLAPDALNTIAAPTTAGVSNTQALGELLYTKYFYWFQVAGLILLVAMIGAIVLTLRHKEGVKRQVISDQVARGPATAVQIVKVESGKGLHG
jgi:NADH-quinone oxidoreductase subunit J